MFALFFELFFVEFFHFTDLAVFVIEGKPGFDFSFELVLTKEHGRGIDDVGIGDSESIKTYPMNIVMIALR